MLSKAGFATLIPIKNMDRAVKFYTKVLGGKLRMRDKGEMKDMFASVTIGKTEFWLVNPPESERAEPAEVAYNAFVVKDIKKEVAALKKKGAKFDPAEKSEWTEKTEGPIAYDPMGATAFLKDTEGNLLMIYENNM